MTQSSCRWVLALATVLWAARSAQADDLVQAPQLAAPQRGSLAGEYGNVAFGPADVDRGGFTLPSPMHAPQERGALMASVFPSYSADAGLSEWGMGFSQTLAITRTQVLGGIDYSTDDLTGPWGRMVRGSDGSYYATNLNAQVRLQFKDQQLIVIAPSGDRYVFGGGDARFETTRGTYAWYLTDVQSLTGRKTHLAWAKNGSGRRFLETVLYGGIGDDYQYQIDFSYEPTDYLFVSYLSGVESTLDRRVHAVTVRTKNGAGGSFDERWHYTLAYQQDKLGPGFFLTEVDQTYASGESAPPFRFGYRQAADGLATRSFQRATALEPMLSQFGQDVIQSNVSALVDIDQDGRPDLEERGGNSILQQTDKGYVVVPLGPMPKGASPLCRRAPSRFNLPRTLVEGMDGSDAVRVLGIQPNSVHTGTQIDLCERDGTVVGTQALAGYWQPSANVKLVDLNRDHQPDLIRVERAMYTVLPNISEKNGLAFDVPRGGLLSPPFTPSASYVQDMNGDGIPDLVARTNTIVTVWLGTGDYNFLTEGQSYELRSRSGLLVTGLDGFNFNFLDANRDGLSDLLLTRGTSFFLFVNDGLTFKEVAFPALNGLGTGASPPVVADLTGTGNTSVTITFRGQVVALELDDPGVGLLASVDDGRGNLLQLTYGRGPAAAGGRQRHSVLQSLTVNTTGQDAMRYSYSYLGPTVHSRGKFFLGYGEVTRSDPQQATSMTLLNDDDVTGVALSSSTVETLTPSVSRYVVNAYEARTYLNVPWMRMTSARTGWANGNGSQTLEERTDYLTYDNEVCPTQVQTTKEAGKLTTITTRASVDKLADALHCLPDTVTTVSDARSDLQEQTHFARNGVGLPVSIESVGSDGGLTLQSIAYNDDFTIAAITKPGRGTVTFGYDPTTHLLLRMVSPEGVVTAASPDPLSDSMLGLAVDRGALAYAQSFRFDGQERLVKSWDDLGGASEGSPRSQVQYRYATATQPASYFVTTLIDAATGSATRSVELSTAKGDALAKASLIPEGWAFSELTQRTVNKGEVTRLLRSTWAGGDPRALDVPSLLAGANVISDTVATASGTPITSATRFHSDVQQQISGSLALSGHLIETAVENGRRTTQRTLDAGKRMIAFTDQAATTWRYHYDARDRLRAVELPDGTGHRIAYDDHGRIRHIERDGIGSIDEVYDPTTGLLRSERIVSADGARARVASYEHDGAGRRVRETHTDSATGARESFTYYYDGATPNAPYARDRRGLLTAVAGDGFVKLFDYRADGKVVQRTMIFSGWRAVETSFSYFDDGSPSGKTVIVRDAQGTVLQSSSQSTKVDAWGRQAGLLLNGQPLAQFAYDAFGMPTTATFTGGETATRSYDSLTRALVGLSQATSAWSSSDGFKLNDRGFIGQETLGVGQESVTRTYDYSPPGFLIGSGDAKTQYRYGFDAFGLSNSIEENATSRAITRAGDTLAVGDSSYSFDSFGRVVQMGDLQLTYGPAGDVVAATRGDKQWTFTYDESGHRILKSCAGEPVAAYLDEGYLEASGLTEAVSFAGTNVGVLRRGQFTMVANDARGTIMADLDGTPRLPSPFGDRQVHPDIAAAIDYVQKGYDADLGLIRMGVRDYDPRSNRFTTPDPLFLAHPEKCLDSPVECNLYSYARNNPLTHHDPSGMADEENAAAPAKPTLDDAMSKMVDNAKQEMADNPGDWSTAAKLPQSSVTAPNLYWDQINKKTGKGFEGYEGKFKCNIFVSEMLHRAGLMIAKPLGQVDAIVDDAREAKVGGTDKLSSGAKQWFDPVAHESRTSDVKAGDLLVINSSERPDSKTASHGHIVIVSGVTRNEAGKITELRVAGAGTLTGREGAAGGKGSTTFGSMKNGVYEFASGTEILRPRLAQ